MAKNPDLVKFIYVTDPSFPGRVLCIARRIRDGKIKIAYSLNRTVVIKSITTPDFSRISLEEKNLYENLKLRTNQYFVVDRFSKKKAREISKSKLETSEHEFEVVSGESPVKTVLKYMVTCPTMNNRIKDIVTRGLGPILV